jgi:orotate phosphoribosyltransferase
MSEVVSKVSEALFASGCLKFGTFKIKSGATSPYYIDLAQLLSSPQRLCDVADIVARETENLMRTERIDKLASIELKGALLLPSVGCRVGLPCVVVRKQEKSYGAIGRIAGAEVAEGDRILFFDDVVSEGLSKLEGIKPLEELGAKVKNMIIVVDREQGGKATLEKLGYEVNALTTITELTETLLQSLHITEEQATSVRGYVKTFKEHI